MTAPDRPSPRARNPADLARHLVLAALATPDPDTDDHLAALTTRGTGSWADLVAVSRGDRDLPGGVDATALGWCGYLLAARSQDDAPLRHALHLLDLAVADGGPRSLTPDLARVHAQLAFLVGDEEGLERALRSPKLDDETAWQVRTDRHNPFLGSGATDGGDWIGELGRPFADHGLLPVALADGAAAPFHRLRVPGAVPGSVRGPLVTVVVPVHRPDPTDLGTAVASIAAQTWADLEILLCDDASDDAGLRVVHDSARLDHRARVLTTSRNGGAYSARNRGIAAAAGDFVTFHDADDWAHPQRIERQMEVLLADAGVVCSLSWALRASLDLALTRVGRWALRPNMSSSIYRTETVRTRFGGFDAVRRSADAELIGRTRAALGEGSVAEDTAPMAVLQMTPASLSRDDFSMSWIHPDRAAYKRSARRWHQRIRDAGASPHVAPGTRAPFPAPPYVTGTPAGTESAAVGLLGDLDPRNRTAVDIGAEVERLAARFPGLLVVDVPGLADLRPQGLEVDEALEDAAARGEVHRLGHRVPGRVGLLVVRDPSSVRALRSGEVDLGADEAVVVVDVPARTEPFDPATTVAVLEGIGARVRWHPTTEEVARDLRARLADPATVLDPAPWGTTAAEPGPTVSRTTVAHAPVVDELRRPDALRLVRDFDPSPEPFVAPPRVARLLDLPAPGLPAAWDGDPSVLRSLSVVVLPALDPDRRGVDVTILRCLAAGVVVVSDPAVAARYGGAVVPAEPDGVPDVVRRLREDDDLRRALRSRARAHVDGTVDRGGWESRITGLARDL